MLTVLSNKMVVTRKPHQCHGCLRIMPPQTEMERFSGVYDDRVYSIYTCRACISIISRHAVLVADVDGQTYDGCVAEFIRDEGYTCTPEEFLFLSRVNA